MSEQKQFGSSSSQEERKNGNGNDTDQEVQEEELDFLVDLRPWDLMLRRTQARPSQQCIIEECKDYDGGGSSRMCPFHEWKSNQSRSESKE